MGSGRLRMGSRKIMQNMIPRWLKLKQAASYAAINEKRLIELARQRHVKGFQDTETKSQIWIFDRFSLDAYRESQCLGLTIREKALDILRGVPV